MAAVTPKLLVIGGNGFVGSSVCRKAVQRGWQVTSLSRSGKPWQSRSGHRPVWVNEVDWQAGSVFDPSTVGSLASSSTAVVSTLGILLESDYKPGGAVSLLSLLRGIVEHALGSKGSPLDPNRRTYEQMNRDAALAAFRAFAATGCPAADGKSSPFVYISAEDVFRPFVPEGYIKTKRETEKTIWREVAEQRRASGVIPTGGRTIRPLFVRPSLIYHPHMAPLTTLPATLLEGSAHIQSILPTPLRATSAFPARRDPLRPDDLPPSLSSLASLLTVPPIHVDAVGESVCRAIEDEHMQGVLDVAGMRNLLGFDTLFDEQIRRERAEKAQLAREAQAVREGTAL